MSSSSLFIFFLLWNVLLAQEWDANEVTGKNPRQPYVWYCWYSLFCGFSKNRIKVNRCKHIWARSFSGNERYFLSYYIPSFLLSSFGTGKYSIVLTSKIPSTLKTSSSENSFSRSQLIRIWSITRSWSLSHAGVDFLSFIEIVVLLNWRMADIYIAWINPEPLLSFQNHSDLLIVTSQWSMKEWR